VIRLGYVPDSGPPGPGLAPRPARRAGQSYRVSQIRGRAGVPTVGRMVEFLAETYAPRCARGTVAPTAAEAALAAVQVSRLGAPVRFPRAVVVPDDQTGVRPYQASSADTVRAAMTHARLRPGRITPGRVGQATPRPPGPRTQHPGHHPALATCSQPSIPRTRTHVRTARSGH
jgi:hypothetical protein